mmetsp:Transcript_42208/g.90053  ORF Transcript_42208/g.90053 Transcript_42208/m.90053 type:complete len:429 (-) Transcript_42208:151-1437(-)
MLIAVEGCCHGELDSIYASIANLEQRDAVKVDVLLICGDFQAVRNASDLATMACPPKYRAMQTFYKYYTGEKVAPVLTIVIGGNHEASNHLWELYHGGWLAPNIFFLGYAGIVNVGGVRIGGLTGIFNRKHYHLGHYESPPYSPDDMRSAYHIRELEVLRLKQLQHPLDIMLSHDWPQHIARHGNLQSLYRRKSFLQPEVEDGSLGSPPALELLQALKPSYWFSAHLHVKFAAVVQHDDGRATRFLSLDKCLPRRDFLQLVRLAGDGSPPTLQYDAEWIAVLRATAALFSVGRGRLPLDRASLAAAAGGRQSFAISADEEKQVLECVGGDMTVPLNFTPTVSAYRAGEPIVAAQPSFAENVQTSTFVRTFKLPADFRTQTAAPVPAAGRAAAGQRPPAPSFAPGAEGLFQSIWPATAPLSEEIDLEDD